MFEYKNVLDKIEKLVDQLPYKTVKIEIDLGSETLIQRKKRSKRSGFSAGNRSVL